MSKYKTDYERLEIVKEFKVSHMSVMEFSRVKGINRTSLRDWINAYDNIDGSFVRLNKVVESGKESVLLQNSDVTVNMLKPEDIMRKSRNFTRFDHSVVVIEINKVKVTTSLEQALAILGKIL